MTLLEIAQKRRAAKQYNKDKKISEEDLKYIFEVAITSPTSIGLEAWRIISMRNIEVKNSVKLGFKDYNIDRFLDSSDTAFIVTKTKKWFDLKNEKFVEHVKRSISASAEEYSFEVNDERVNGLGNIVISEDHGNNGGNIDEWSKRQAYIVSAFVMLAAQEKGIESTPVEGFTKDMDKILREQKLIGDDESLALVVLLGYVDGREHPFNGKKQRRAPFEDKIKYIK